MNMTMGFFFVVKFLDSKVGSCNKHLKAALSGKWDVGSVLFLFFYKKLQK